jgi:hypothetical protein
MRDIKRAFLVVSFLFLATSALAQIPWETSLSAAQAKAKKEGKPILLLHLFGRLDQEFT